MSFLQDAYNPERGSFKNMVPLAIIMQFYEKEGRPPLNSDHIPTDAWWDVAKQLDHPLPKKLEFDWEGRTAKRFHQKVREFLGYRVTHLCRQSRSETMPNGENRTRRKDHCTTSVTDL